MQLPYLLCLRLNDSSNYTLHVQRSADENLESLEFVILENLSNVIIQFNPLRANPKNCSNTLKICQRIV